MSETDGPKGKARKWLPQKTGTDWNPVVLTILASVMIGLMIVQLSLMFVQFSGVRGEIASVRTELKGEIASVRGEIASVRTELKGEISSVRTELGREIDSLRIELKGGIESVRGELAAFREESSRQYGEIVGQMIHIQNSLSVQIQETKDALGSLKQEFAKTRGEIMSEAREVARETARAEGVAWRQRVEAKFAAGPEGIREGAGERTGETGPG